MSRYDDIDPMDIDPETGEPYANYSSPALDTAFHDGEMDVGDVCECCERKLPLRDGVCRDCEHPDDTEFYNYDPGEEF